MAEYDANVAGSVQGPNAGQISELPGIAGGLREIPGFLNPQQLGGGSVNPENWSDAFMNMTTGERFSDVRGQGPGSISWFGQPAANLAPWQQAWQQFLTPHVNEHGLVPQSAVSEAMSRFPMPQDKMQALSYGPLVLAALFSGGLASGALGAAGAAGAAGAEAGIGAAAGAGVAGGGAAGLGAADLLGLAQMAEAAGLSGAGAEAFIASGGALGSTAAGGGGVGTGFLQNMPRSIPDLSALAGEDAAMGQAMTEAGAAGGGPGINVPLTTTNFGGPVGTGGTGGGFNLQTIQNFLRNPLGSIANLATSAGGGGDGGGGGGTGGSSGGGFLSDVLNIGSGLFGLQQANALKRKADEEARLSAAGGGVAGTINAAGQASATAGREAAGLADPFAPFRADAARQLAALMANPSSITGRPGYQFRMDQGTQAIARRMAGGGYSGSGNEAIALQQYAQDYASNELNQEIARLATLSGASNNPANAAQLLLSGQQDATRAATSAGQLQLAGTAQRTAGNISAIDLASRALASLGYGVRRLGV